MKKSQLQIMQTSFVILIFIIIVAVGLIVYVFMAKAGNSQKQKEYAKAELIKKSQIINFLPEIQCSFNNVITPDCYDIEKIKAFTDANGLYANNKDYYDSIFGTTKIVIKKFDLKSGTWETGWLGATDGNFLLYENSLKKFRQKRKIMFPISLYDPVTNQKSFGLIDLEIYV
ncbi:MAG: hypothetical protein V1859_01285 [archaeon]